MGKSAGDEVDMRCATFVLLKGGKKSFKTLSNLFSRTALQRYLGKGCLLGALGSL